MELLAFRLYCRTWQDRGILPGVLRFVESQDSPSDFGNLFWQSLNGRLRFQDFHNWSFSKVAREFKVGPRQECGDCLHYVSNLLFGGGGRLPAIANDFVMHFDELKGRFDLVCRKYSRKCRNGHQPGRNWESPKRMAIIPQHVCHT